VSQRHRCFQSITPRHRFSQSRQHRSNALVFTMHLCFQSTGVSKALVVPRHSRVQGIDLSQELMSRSDRSVQGVSESTPFGSPSIIHCNASVIVMHQSLQLHQSLHCISHRNPSGGARHSGVQGIGESEASAGARHRCSQSRPHRSMHWCLQCTGRSKVLVVTMHWSFRGMRESKELLSPMNR
jgi:hypothetical protein